MSTLLPNCNHSGPLYEILLNHILYILNHGTQVCDCCDEIKARSVCSLWRTNLKIWEFKRVLLISCEIQFYYLVRNIDNNNHWQWASWLWPLKYARCSCCASQHQTTAELIRFHSNQCVCTPAEAQFWSDCGPTPRSSRSLRKNTHNGARRSHLTQCSTCGTGRWVRRENKISFSIFQNKNTVWWINLTRNKETQIWT